MWAPSVVIMTRDILDLILRCDPTCKLVMSVVVRHPVTRFILPLLGLSSHVPHPKWVYLQLTIKISTELETLSLRQLPLSLT